MNQLTDDKDDHIKVYSGRKYYLSDNSGKNFNSVLPPRIVEASKIGIKTQLRRLVRGATLGSIFPYFEDENEIIYCLDKVDGNFCLEKKVQIHNIGHATHLIQYSNINILTDPVYKINSILYPRKTEAGIKITDLPIIDVICISHNHHDHMDIETIKYIYQKNSNVLLLIPEGVDKLKLINSNINENNIIEHKWYDNTYIDDIKFTSMPADHWSGRNIKDTQMSDICSWIIDDDIFFAGDSSYNQKYDAIIFNNFHNLSVIIQPAGPNYDRHLMKATHKSVIESIKSFINLIDFDNFDENTLSNKYLYFNHHNTFELGPDKYNISVKILKQTQEYLSKKLNNNINSEKCYESYEFDIKDYMILLFFGHIPKELPNFFINDIEDIIKTLKTKTKKDDNYCIRLFSSIIENNCIFPLIGQKNIFDL